MLLSKHEIVSIALKALYEKLALPEELVVYTNGNEYKETDALIRIMNVDFLCKVKNTITTSTLGALDKELEKLMTQVNKPILLVANYISPNVVNHLATRGINTLDCVGNCHIQYTQGENVAINLINKGEKNKCIGEKTSSAFSDTGLKVIFFFLLDEENVNKPYREIQEATRISLGSIKNIVENLVEHNFILLNKNKRALRNKSYLFSLWHTNYTYRLKPKLLLGKMSFRPNELRGKWKAMNLPKGMYWGGECGAHLLDAYLEPGTFEIYTDIPMAHLLKTGFVRQDEQGEICIYQKFWQWNTDKQVVPPALIYADLMAKESGRCYEMAQKLLDSELKNFK